MDKKKKLISALAAIVVLIVIFAGWLLIKKGYVSVKVNKPILVNPLTGQAVTQEELDGKTANDLYKDAVELNKGGNYQVAEEFLQKAAEKDGGSPNINLLRELAVSAYNLKNYDSAIELYKKIIGTNSDNAAAYNELGNVYRDKGDKEMAKESYEKAISADANYLLAYNNLAMLNVADNNYDEARSVIQRGIKNNPDSSELKDILNSLVN